MRPRPVAAVLLLLASRALAQELGPHELVTGVSGRLGVFDVADVNAGGFPDLAIAYETGVTSGAKVYFGNGTLTPTGSVTLTTSPLVEAIELRDLDLDGDVDCAIAR